eukprot:8848305-Lingulodinium_polyedra.AAC.1
MFSGMGRIRPGPLCNCLMVRLAPSKQRWRARRTPVRPARRLGRHWTSTRGPMPGQSQMSRYSPSNASKFRLARAGRSTGP